VERRQKERRRKECRRKEKNRKRERKKKVNLPIDKAHQDGYGNEVGKRDSEGGGA